MTGLHKWMIALAPQMASATENPDTLLAWAQNLTSQIADLRGLAFEHVALDAHHAHAAALSGTARDPEWTSVLCVWADEPGLLHTPLPDGYKSFAVKVIEHFAFDDTRTLDAVGQTPGFKKTTFWKAPDDVPPPLWQQRYHAHVASVRSCHPAWSYR